MSDLRCTDRWLSSRMKDVSLDAASSGRLKPHETHDAGHKWLIFDRSSVQTKRAFQPYPEWIEAELAYDIAGLRRGDQDAVLAALSRDTRDPKAAAIGMLQKQQQSSPE